MSNKEDEKHTTRLEILSARGLSNDSAQKCVYI
jgi:hypothetical protein